MSEGITANQLVAGVVAIQQVTVEILHADIIALPTTSIIIVEAPETSKALRYRLATITTNWEEVDNYDNIDPSANIGFYYGAEEANASARGLQGTLTALFANSQPITVEFPVVSNVDLIGGTLLPTETVVNSYAEREIRLAMFNGAAGNLTGGNAANKLIVTVEYSEINLSL